MKFVDNHRSLDKINLNSCWRRVLVKRVFELSKYSKAIIQKRVLKLKASPIEDSHANHRFSPAIKFFRFVRFCKICVCKFSTKKPNKNASRKEKEESGHLQPFDERMPEHLGIACHSPVGQAFGRDWDLVYHRWVLNPHCWSTEFRELLIEKWSLEFIWILPRFCEFADEKWKAWLEKRDSRYKYAVFQYDSDESAKWLAECVDKTERQLT